MADNHHHEHHGHDQGHWNDRYASTARLFNAEPDESLVELAGDLPPGRAVDLGAGEGRNSLWLAKRKWQVTAVDLSDIALGRLASAAAEENLSIKTVVGDMLEYLDKGEKFDLVVLAYIQWMPEERAKLLAAAAGAVAPGGYLLLVGHHLESLGKGGPPQPERLYTEDSLKDAFPGLDLIHMERRERAAGDIGLPLVDAVVWAVRPKNQQKP
ncbi:MAG: class I SAM-dependent methyltransferase [Actinomycetota bacterium]|nr:MAG: class I SAM-dependent methyltransferase [Actinomycetota bacterium]